MKQLEELEKKVLQIVEKNKELKDENELLKLENEQIKKKAVQLESTLMSKSQNSEHIENESKVLKSSIEDLLTSLSFLDTPNDESTKSN